jgi:hypothetical protein
MCQSLNQLTAVIMGKKAICKDFLLLFRGGADPRHVSSEELRRIMDLWFAWMKKLKKRGQFKVGHPLEEAGKVLSGRKGRNVAGFVEAQDSVGGYLLIQARNLAEATKIARECPILENGGTVEVRPILPMAKES